MSMCGKTFSENLDVLCEGIMKAIEMAQPCSTWTEWDSFGGRLVYHSESTRDAQKRAVKKFLTKVFEPEEQKAKA